MITKRKPAKKKPSRKRRAPKPAPPPPRAAVYVCGTPQTAALIGLSLLKWAEQNDFDVVTGAHDGLRECAKFRGLHDAIRVGNLLAVIVDARHCGRVNIRKTARLFAGVNATLVTPAPEDLQTFTTFPDLDRVTDVLNEQIGISAAARRLNLSIPHVSLARITALSKGLIHFNIAPTLPRPKHHESRCQEVQ